MFCYFAYSKYIEIDLEIPFLSQVSPKSRPIDVTIKHKKNLSKDFINFNLLNGDNGLIHRPGIGFFHIENPGSIYYDFDGKPSINDLLRVILNQCMAYFFFQEGKMSLHASSVIKNNKAFLFSGPSGSGKSSIAYMLSDSFKIISEDLSVIDNFHSSYVYSSYPLIKLNLDDLDKSDNLKKNIIYKKDKLNRVGYMLDKRFLNDKRIEIKKCIFLNWGNENKIKKLDAEGKFQKLLQNSFKPIPYNSDINSTKMLLQNISNFSKNVEMFEIDRLRGSDSLDIIKSALD